MGEYTQAHKAASQLTLNRLIKIVLLIPQNRTSIRRRQSSSAMIIQCISLLISVCKNLKNQLYAWTSYPYVDNRLSNFGK